MSDKTFIILNKKYHRNLTNKINTVYFKYNNEDFEIDVLYIKSRNRYALVQNWRETREEFEERLEQIGISSKERQEEFLTALNKYSKLRQMKEW